MKVFSCQDKAIVELPQVIAEDEAVAVMAAIEAFLQSQNVEAPQAVAEKPSQWQSQFRLANAGLDGKTSIGHTKGKLWGSLLSTLALSLALSLPANAQEIGEMQNVEDTPQIAAAPRQLNNVPVNGNRQSMRVFLKDTQKLDLDMPDGAEIFSYADGVSLGKIAARSSFSMNLSGQKVCLRGKTPQDRVRAPEVYQKTAFTSGIAPSGSGPADFFLPLKKMAASFTSSDESQSPQAANFDPSQGYIFVPQDMLIGVGNRYYRGAILVKPVTVGSTTVMRVINVVDLEDYLLSVVPSEVPSKWPAEVLKAQAIAARSYAIANLNKHKKEGYDVKDTVDDQVYLGVQSENDDTNKAVADTESIVLKHNNAVISAFFHSTSGGATELAEHVWSKPVPYLKSVTDYDDESPHFNWKRVATLDKLTNLLMAAKTANKPGTQAMTGDGYSPSESLLGVFVVSRYPGDSKRVKNVILVGNSRVRMVTGSELRKLFNLPSTQFSVFQGDEGYIFSGRGFGHGLGLSQWGAKALADKGYNAGQILTYYYKDVTIESLDAGRTQGRSAGAI